MTGTRHNECTQYYYNQSINKTHQLLHVSGYTGQLSGSVELSNSFCTMFCNNIVILTKLSAYFYVQTLHTDL
jgi:uncharacterized protein (DUF2164 family)